MPQGIIKKIGDYFGFILKEDGNWLHFKAKCLIGVKLKDLSCDDWVEYEEGTATEKGSTAAWVKRIKSAAKAAEHTTTHSLPPSTDYLFRNPYNFVRFLTAGKDETDGARQLGRGAPPSHEYFEGLSGTITCTFKTETPLFIAGHIEERNDKHKELDFFMHDGKPLIPASSLRGMVRSVFETITNSCMMHMQRDEEDHLEYRASRDPGLIPARIKSVSDGEGGTLEMFDCTRNAPEDLSGDLNTLRCGLFRAYEKRVKYKEQGEQKTYETCLLPDWAIDGQRVAAIVSTKRLLHYNKDHIPTYYYYKVNTIEKADQSQSLSVRTDEKLVFGYLKITGPNIENKHDERLFFDWDDINEKSVKMPELNFSNLHSAGREPAFFDFCL